MEIGLIFPNQEVDAVWQHKRIRGQLVGLRREFSFLVNEFTDPGIGLTGDGVGGSGKAVTFGPLRCALVDAPRKPGSVIYSHTWSYSSPHQVLKVSSLWSIEECS
jgi:hypothetical protein